MEESSSSLPSMEINEENEGAKKKNDENEKVKGEVEMQNRVNEEEKVEEPKVGMIFKTTDEVFEYYKKYAMQLGFPVHKRSSDKDLDGVLRYLTFSCALSGKSRSNSKNIHKPQSSIKTNCKALIRAALCPDGTWRVSSAKLDHNHELNPEKACYFRCYRGPKLNVKRKLGENDKTAMVTQVQLSEGDVTSILNYFLKKQTQNSNFFHAIDLDKEGLLRTAFWADARSQAAYEEFGDVILFDTTYLTNKYAMPFVSFEGVNHHGQQILFGCGLVTNEDTDTFIWLFKSWLACMSGHSPCGIITFRDKAIENAIENVFPNARYRWCLGNIMKKLSEKLKDYYQDESLRLALESVVYHSLSPAEFEERWNEMIEKYELNSNDWLIGLYYERHRWVPAFVKESFWAGMSPIQQSESMHPFFDEHVKSKTTLKHFAKRYENALRNMVDKEDHEDFKCISPGVNCVTHYDMEKQVQDVYTTSKFEEFQNELTGKMYCEFDSIKVDGTCSEYQISEDIMIGETKKSVNFKVLFNEYGIEVKCSCCMYEFRGILCKHAIYVLIRHKIHLLPDKYIMRRWRKDVKRCHKGVKFSYDDSNATPEAHRCNKMQKTFNEIEELANDSEDNCMIVMAWMDKLKEELCNRKGDCGNSQPTPMSLDGRSSGNDVNVVSKENQNVPAPNHSYGGYGVGNITHPNFYEHHVQDHGHQLAWNGGFGMFSMPNSSSGGDGNQRPS